LWNRVKLDAMSVRRFREEQGPGRERPTVADAIRAGRRLNRALRRLRGTDGLSGEAAATLRRVLRRTCRLADAVMQAMEPARGF
jgi:hypothetical protein